MPLNPIDKFPPPTGFSTAEPSELPADKAQALTGFVPARRGRLDLAPLLKRIETEWGITIVATAVWNSHSGANNRLLLFADKVYSFNLANTWQYDERQDGQHSHYVFPASLNIVASSYDFSVPFFSVQFGAELIVGSDTLYRYYVASDGAGTEYWYNLGVQPPPGAPSVLGGQTGSGGLTVGGTYQYLYTITDELKRESSPSPLSVTTTVPDASHTAVRVTQNAGGYVPGGGETYWNIYRLNPGGKVPLFVAQVPFGTLSYLDNIPDSVVNAGASAPSAGENDVGTILGANFFAFADAMCRWKDRLVLAQGNIILLSNAGSPTQFSSLPLPTNVADGMRFELQAYGQGDVVGMEVLGDTLVIFGRTSTTLLYGDDITNFTQRPTLKRGCLNVGSIQWCETVILFLSDDGVYALDGAYLDHKVSLEVDEMFRGFTLSPLAAASGRLQSVQSISSLFGAVTSWYMEDRYYLSFGDKTLCYDLQTQGWSDTGWGFIKTATRYLSAYPGALPGIYIPAPDTVFLTVSDPHAYLPGGSNEIHYFTVADTPDDVDSPRGARSKVVYRPMAGNQQIKVRPTFLSVYGKTNANFGSVIGKITWGQDGLLVGDQPIFAGIVWRRKDALFEVVPPNLNGYSVWFMLEFYVNDIVVGNAYCEYVRTG